MSHKSNLNSKTPAQSLSHAFLKQKPSKEKFEEFETRMESLLAQIVASVNESEEHYKTHISEFLKYSMRSPEYYINTNGNIDLAINNGKLVSDSVGVIIEAKRPANQIEMPKVNNINVKAMQELLLYYLRERIGSNNISLKHLIITNGYEWYIFQAHFFEKEFAKNTSLVKHFKEFELGSASGNTTDFFYKEIAKPAINEVVDIEFVYFDLRKANSRKEKIALLKIFSPEYMLKLPYINDSNTLNNDFYNELLHIIGLVEIKDGGKKLIRRKPEGARNRGSLIENAIYKLDTQDRLRHLANRKSFGDTVQDQLFNVALELVITWVNRVLFLKLLEGQLIAIHDPSYAFLNFDKIKSYDALDDLFFAVLARNHDERQDDIKKLFGKVPYLNSSLFEPTDIEGKSIYIGNLTDELTLPIFVASVLKNAKGKRKTGDLKTLEYLFAFLDSYDFSSDDKGELKNDSKALISASVLGLIFEKVNGYKDGSYYTPGFVTMYMSREALRHAVIQKFNEVKKWNCRELNDVYNQIGLDKDDRDEANSIINSLRICDPAVGSGHFLVSALNELIIIKSELGVLQDCDGKRLKRYSASIVSDELILVDEDGDEFAYKPSNAESCRVQKTLFDEKRRIIENCIFGVDINPNSVKICRLRLWIELLKNAYYNDSKQLETLPNIDINIKVGNSLLSRFSLDEDLKNSLKRRKLTLAQYRDAVDSYKNAKTKDQKYQMEQLISDVKNDFCTEIFYHDPKAIKLANLKAEITLLELPQTLLDELINEKEAREKKQQKLTVVYDKLNTEIERIKNNKAYENSFEWRFEFPEILDDKGCFQGFDVIVGNPPYGVSVTGESRKALVKSLGKVPDFEIYYWFINLGKKILRKNGQLSFIIPNTLLFNVFAQAYRLEMLKNWTFEEVVDCTDFVVFSDASVRNVVIRCSNNSDGNRFGYRETSKAKSLMEIFERPLLHVDSSVAKENNSNWGLIFKSSADVAALVAKIKRQSTPLQTYFPETSQGLIAYDKHAGQSDDLIKKRVFHSTVMHSQDYKPWLYGEDVRRYSVAWNAKEYINCSGNIANPRKPIYFSGKRVLIREITNPGIYAGYTQDELYFDPSVIVVMDSLNCNFTLYSLLGILNSKLATFFHFNSSPKATKGTFPKILVYDINNFPLPRDLSSGICLLIDGKVSEILKMRNVDSSSDTSALEDEVNRLVYQLYGLTPQEISTVEGTEVTTLDCV